MSVYIEYVILDNFIIDCIILYAAARTLKLKAGKFRIALGAVAGTAFAVLLPLFYLEETLLFIVKLSAGIIMVAAISPLRLKKFLLSYILFLTYTFVLGGSILGLLFMLNADVYSAATLNYGYGFPIGLIIGAVFLYAMLLIRLCRYIERRKNIYPFMRRIRLFYGGGEFEATGFLDSGNRLYDYDGSPVMVITAALAERMVNAETMNALYAGVYSGGDFVRKEFKTAQNTHSCMFLFKIVKLWIYSDKSVNTIENVSVGIALTGFKGIEGCDALLHGDMAG